MLAKPSDFLTNHHDTMLDAETSVALDACEAGKTDAHKLLAGVPCTISIGSDSYAAVIVRATASLQTIHVTRVQTHPDGCGKDKEGWPYNQPNTLPLALTDADDPDDSPRWASEVYSYSEMYQHAGEVYRLTNRGYRRSSYQLHVGVAVDYRDPSF